MKIDGGEMFASMLEREGVENVFAVHGGHIDPIFQACRRQRARLRQRPTSLRQTSARTPVLSRRMSRPPVPAWSGPGRRLSPADGKRRPDRPRDILEERSCAPWT